MFRNGSGEGFAPRPAWWACLLFGRPSLTDHLSTAAEVRNVLTLGRKGRCTYIALGTHEEVCRFALATSYETDIDVLIRRWALENHECRTSTTSGEHLNLHRRGVEEALLYSMTAAFRPILHEKDEATTNDLTSHFNSIPFHLLLRRSMYVEEQMSTMYRIARPSWRGGKRILFHAVGCTNVRRRF